MRYDYVNLFMRKESDVCSFLFSCKWAKYYLIKFLGQLYDNFHEFIVYGDQNKTYLICDKILCP